MSGMTATKRFIIRTSLITGSTLATIFGAQSLAALDTHLFATNANANTTAPMALPQSVTVAAPSPTSAPRQAEPSIVILRRQGQSSSSTTTQAASGSSAPVVSIQPPAPMQVQAPAPVIVQQQGAPVVVQAPAPSSRPSR
ncbi:MAG: hypothetical protein H6673_11770 [Anaerolineales bacterium]|nr:hypothetical protein [Anaerolineales bacterium]